MVLRTLAFKGFFYLWTALVSLIGVPLLVSTPLAYKVARFWAWGTVVGLRVLAGVSWRVEGREHLPDPMMQGGMLIASKHQSVFETVVCYALFPQCCYVLKKELQSIPVFGWYMRVIGCIAIDRGQGASALKHLVRDAKERLAQGKHLVLFPEGTRMKPGAQTRLKPGVAAIYTQIEAPLVPMWLDSGTCWSPHRFLIHPGVITFRLSKPLEQGLKRDACVAQLEQVFYGEGSVQPTRVAG